MTKNGHGRGGYMKGCRCDICTKANNAYCWALRRAKEWSEPVSEGLARAGDGPAVFVGKDITISGEQLREALRRHDKHIKIEALTALWHRLSLKTGRKT